MSARTAASVSPGSWSGLNGGGQAWSLGPTGGSRTVSGRDVVLIGARGGQGTSTVAAVVALHSALAEPTELITSDVGAMAALLGVPGPDERGTVVVSERLTITAEPISPVGRRVYDCPPQATDTGGASRTIGVLRGPCYLALRSLVSHPGRLDGIVVLLEPGRALTARDVEDVTGVPVVAAVAVSAAVARTIDAGLLAARYAKLRDLAPLRRYANHLDEAAGPPAPTAAGHPKPAALNRSGQLTVSRTHTDLPVAQAQPAEPHVVASRQVLALMARNEPARRAEHRSSRRRCRGEPLPRFESKIRSHRMRRESASS